MPVTSKAARHLRASMVGQLGAGLASFGFHLQPQLYRPADQISLGDAWQSFSMVAPVASLASPEADPIFALIETHREAVRQHAAVCAELSRREQVLIDEGIGLCPYVTMVWRGRPIVAETHQQIDAYAVNVTEQVRARAHSELDTTLDHYKEVFGNIENEAGDIGDVASDAFYDMITTVPTSVPGLRALLAYLSEDVADLGQQLDANNSEMLIYTIHDALLELNPSDAAGGMV